MKRIVTLTVLGMMVLGSAALANDLSRQGLGIMTDPVPGTTASLSAADVFIASSTNGNFTDLSPFYETALLNAGATTVTTVVDGPDSPFVFPSPFTSAEFGTVVVLTNDNWWGDTNGGPEQNVSLQDEAALSAYMDTGGTMLFSGQDYIYGRGNIAGFPQIYLGILAINEDINFSDTDITYTGVAGGPMDGLAGALHAEATAPIGPCFDANPFFSDDVTSFGGELADYNSMPTNVNGQCGTAWDVGAFKTVFTTVDFACTDNTAQFQAAATAMYLWLTGAATPVEQSSWGSLKQMYK